MTAQEGHDGALERVPKQRRPGVLVQHRICLPVGCPQAGGRLVLAEVKEQFTGLAREWNLCLLPGAVYQISSFVLIRREAKPMLPPASQSLLRAAFQPGGPKARLILRYKSDEGMKLLIRRQD